MQRLDFKSEIGLATEVNHTLLLSCVEAGKHICLQISMQRYLSRLDKNFLRMHLLCS